MQVNWIGILASVNIVITTGNITFTASVQKAWIETETTQEGVLKTLKAHEAEISRIHDEHVAMRESIKIMPFSIDASDRWTGTQQSAYSKGIVDLKRNQDDRIDKLELLHIFKHEQ